MDHPDLRALRRPLLRWYDRHRRDLPWRRSRDPFAIWVSEVMAQQTRVEVVIPYYERFLARFPNVAALASATEDEVLALWAGLGYYRRARSILQGARAVVERHGGELPDDPAALLALPGIGPYTAGAIASVAFGREEPVVDGNVRRVLSRLLAGSAGRGAASTRDLWAAARAMVRGGRPGDFNQALMELGATVCVPRAPRCAACPMRRGCRALTSGQPEAYPAPRPRRRPEHVRAAVAVIARCGRVLLEKRSTDTPLRGAWDLPAVEPGDGASEAAIVSAVRRRLGVRVRIGRHLGTVRHAIVHRALALDAFVVTLAAGRASPERARWHRLDRIDAAPVSSATTKVLALLRQVRSQGGVHAAARAAARRGGAASKGRRQPHARPSMRGSTASPTSRPAQ